MSDVIGRLRAHDPERHGSPEPPPVERVLALIDAEEARAAREPAPDRRPVRGTRPFAPARTLRGSAPSGAHLTLPARAVSTAFALGLAAAIVAATLLVALGGGPGDGPVTLGQPAGTADPGAIVHVRSRSYVEFRGRRQRTVLTHGGRDIGATDGPIDRWSTAEPIRWRQVRAHPPLPGSDMEGGTREEAYADGLRLRRSSFGGDRVWRRALRPETWKRDATSPIGDLVKGTADPRAAIEQLVAAGWAQAEGEEVRDGRRLLRFVNTAWESWLDGGRVLGRTIFLLDADSWAPVEMTTESRAGSRRTTLFEVYETLPPTPENLRLLEFGGPEG